MTEQYSDATIEAVESYYKQLEIVIGIRKNLVNFELLHGKLYDSSMQSSTSDNFFLRAFKISSIKISNNYLLRSYSDLYFEDNAYITTYLDNDEISEHFSRIAIFLKIIYDFSQLCQS